MLTQYTTQNLIYLYVYYYTTQNPPKPLIIFSTLIGNLVLSINSFMQSEHQLQSTNFENKSNKKILVYWFFLNPFYPFRGHAALPRRCWTKVTYTPSLGDYFRYNLNIMKWYWRKWQFPALSILNQILWNDVQCGVKIWYRYADGAAAGFNKTSKLWKHFSDRHFMSKV